MIAFDIDGCTNTIKEDSVAYGASFFKGEPYTFDPNGYNLREKYAGLPDERYRQFWETFGVELYTRPPRTGVRETIDYLRSQNIPACFLTARVAEREFYGTTMGELTERWMREWDILLPVYYVPQKKAQTAEQLGVKLAVEDAPKNILPMQEVCRVLIYQMPYNAGLVGERVQNWEEIYKILASTPPEALR